MQRVKLLVCSIAVCAGLSGCGSGDKHATGPPASARDPAGKAAKSEAAPSRPREAHEVFEIIPSSEKWPSIVQILAHLDHYHGKKLLVHGYLVVEREWTAIFLHKDDADNMIASNGLWVSFRDNSLGLTEKEIAKSYSRKYAFVRGTFDKTVDGGGVGLFPGGLVKISRIGELGPPHLVKMPKSPEPKPGARDPFE
jgi:hypothetical protein